MSPSSPLVASVLSVLRRLRPPPPSSRRRPPLAKRWWRSRPPRARARLAAAAPAAALVLWLACLSRRGGDARGAMTDLAIARATVGQLDRFDEHDYSRVFPQLAVRATPQRPYFLSWGYGTLRNRSVTDVTFQLGEHLHDQVTVYKPACVDVRTEALHPVAGARRCLGFNRTYAHLERRCDFKRGVARAANGLRLGRAVSPPWLDRNADAIRWVKGLTVLQKLDRSCANVAHFMGRVLFLHHVLSNLEAYSMPPRNPANVLVLADAATMKRFTAPERYNFYHRRLLAALVAPYNFSVAPLDAFLDADLEDRPPGSGPLHFLLPNLTLVNRDDDADGPGDRGGATDRDRDRDEEVEVMDKRPDSDVRYVCFKRLIIPSYLRARFFVSDHEYPSAKASIVSTVASAPRVPRDSIRLRGRLNAWHDAAVGFRGRRRVVMLFDRAGPRRAFDVVGRARVLRVLRRVGAARGYAVAVRDFDGMPFDAQYGEVRQVAVGVGIHGANLVNAVLMPPLSALVELFPHGFSHPMYRAGGNAGLKYFAHEMSRPHGRPDFDGLAAYASVEECVFRNRRCKEFYRDATVAVRQRDADALEAILHRAIDWSEGLP